MSDYAQDWDSINAGSVDHAAEWDALTPTETKPSSSYSPTGTSYQNFMAGAGKAVADVGRGAKQLIDIPATWLESKFPGISEWSQGLGMPSAKASAEATDADVAESRRLDKPLMATGSGIAGNIAGNIASTMIPLAGVSSKLVNPATYKQAALAGGLMGAVQPTTPDESKIENTALGAAGGMVGNALVNGASAVAQPVANILSTAHQKAVQILSDAGIPLDAAQQSGSSFLGKVRSRFWDNPFTSGQQSELAGTQQALYNKAILKTIGEDATTATPEVMQRADDRIGAVFKDVLDRNNVQVTDPVLAKIGSVQAAAAEDEKSPIVSIANRFINAVGEDGAVSGQTAYNIKKDLDRAAQSQDTTLAYHAGQLRSTIMDAINDSLPADDKTAFQTARQQFRNMSTIEPAIDRMGGGNISPAKLANALATKSNRGASIYGRGDTQLVDLAQAGNLLLSDKNPNSGTTAREIMQMGLPLIAGGAAGGYDAYNGDYTGALEKAATTAGALYAIPKAAQYLINNPTTANYLANGMQGNMRPLRELLMAPQTSQLVGGVARRLPQSGKQSLANPE